MFLQSVQPVNRRIVERVRIVLVDVADAFEKKAVNPKFHRLEYTSEEGLRKQMPKLLYRYFIMF